MPQVDCSSSHTSTDSPAETENTKVSLVIPHQIAPNPFDTVGYIWPDKAIREHTRETLMFQTSGAIAILEKYVARW